MDVLLAMEYMDGGWYKCIRSLGSRDCRRTLANTQSRTYHTFSGGFMISMPENWVEAIYLR